jgi:hypothetical protein
LLFAASIASFTLGVGLTGNATTPQINFCVDKKTSVVTQKTRCSSYERSLTMNSTGIQGPKGDSGIAGQQGPKGDAGPQGQIPSSSVVHIFDSAGNDLGQWVGTSYVFGGHCVFGDNFRTVLCRDDLGEIQAGALDDMSTGVAYFSGPDCSGDYMVSASTSLLPYKFAQSPVMENLSWSNWSQPVEVDLSLGSVQPRSVYWDADSYVAESVATTIVGQSRPRCIPYVAGATLPAPQPGLVLQDQFDYSALTMPRTYSGIWAGYRFIQNFPSRVSAPLTYRAVN